MEAKKQIARKAREHKTGIDSYPKEYSSVLMEHYAKIIILIALMALSYRICLAGSAGYTKSNNALVNITVADTGISTSDSNKMDTAECCRITISNPVSISSKDTASMASLNLVAEQNMVMVDSMLNSYFQGVDAADSTYRVKKIYKSGVFLMTVVVSPLISIFPVAISSIVHPSQKNLHIADAKLNNAAYMKGFDYQAHYIKKRQLWGTFLEGGTPWCMLAAFLLL